MEETVMDVAPVGKVPLVRPLVSIVIPTYNHLDLLKACVDSLMEYTDLSACEVVIVANGCKDGTEHYLKTLPPGFRSIVRPEPLGFTKATNLGIQAAAGEYVVLLNNDTRLLPQARNSWIEQLLAPFRKDPRVGITGPVKFHWKIEDTQYRALAFWCVMIPRRLFDELGFLDEIFSPGMGEDGDFCIKAEFAGYRLVQVPVDSSEEFGKGIPNQVFPIYHKGSGTFGDKDYSDISKRNAEILRQRYGRSDHLEEIYQQAMRHPCDVNELFPTFRKYASECRHVTEFGTRGVMSTWAFLAARPNRLVTYDIEYAPFKLNIDGAQDECRRAGISFQFRQEDVLSANIEPTDLLFIDTTHTYKHLKAELERHAGSVSKFILLHDTESYGKVDAVRG